MFDALAKDLREGARSIDNSYIKVHRSRAGGNGKKEHAIGRSRGCGRTKIHPIADIAAAHKLTTQLPSNGCPTGDVAYAVSGRTWHYAA